MYWASSMRQAFYTAEVTRSTSGALLNKCARTFDRGVGMVNIGKGWNAHLSFKTAQELKAQGIL